MGGLWTPRATICSGKGGRGRSRTGSSPPGGPAPTRRRCWSPVGMPREAVAGVRAPAAPGVESAAAGREDAAEEAGTTRRRGQVLLPGGGSGDRRRRAPRREHQLGTIRGGRGGAGGRAQREGHVHDALEEGHPPGGQGVPARGEDRAAAIAGGRGEVRPARRARVAGGGGLQPGCERPRAGFIHVLHVRRRVCDAQCERAGVFLHQRDERVAARLAVRQQRAGHDDHAGGHREPSPPGGRALSAEGRTAGVPGGVEAV